MFLQVQVYIVMLVKCIIKNNDTRHAVIMTHSSGRSTCKLLSKSFCIELETFTFTTESILVMFRIVLQHLE